MKEFINRYVIPALVVILMLLSPIGDRLQAVFDKTVLPYLDYSSNGWLTALTALIFVLAVWHNCERYKSKTLLETNWLLALVCTNLVILLFWIKGSYCYALMCNGIPFLTYVNCFVLINFSYVVVSLINWIRSRRAKFVRESSVVLNPGKPINQDEINEDYEYKEYIDSIAPIIIDNFDKQVSVSVGISGAWGSGKTSFLHALQKQIKQDKRVARKDRVLIEFKPWFCEKKTDLVQEFFKVYREDMGKRISGFDSDIVEYAKVLTENVDKLKWVNQVMKLCTPMESIQTQFGVITDKLVRYKIPVYIIIDDLDRLDGEEIMEILRLIRITANFPYTQFILAYDKPYIQKAIKKQLDYDNSERFIDKVINTEICLPHFDNYRIGDLLYNELEEYYVEVEAIRSELLNWNPIPGSNHESSFVFIIPKLLPTFRDIHRFVNMFKLDYNTLQSKQEIDFKNFFLLSLIKYAYLDFYKIMALQPEQILFFTRIVKTPYCVYDEIVGDPDFDISTESYEYKLQQAKERIKVISQYNRAEILQTLLNELFDYRSPNKYLISLPLNYNKYFQLQTPIYLLNYIDAISTLSEDNKKYIAQRSMYIRNGEVSRVGLEYYYQNNGQSAQIEKLFQFFKDLLSENRSLKHHVILFFLNFIASQSIQSSHKIKAIEVALQIPFNWSQNGAILIAKDVVNIQNKQELFSLLQSSNNYTLLTAIEEKFQNSSPNFIFSQEEVRQIMFSILNNIMDRGDQIQENKPTLERISEMYEELSLSQDDQRISIEKLRNYSINHLEEYIDDFIFVRNNHPDYFGNLYSLGIFLNNDGNHTYVNILSIDEIDIVFTKKESRNSSKYSNALKLWNWLKENGNEYYTYQDPAQTKSVYQWLKEGMPDMDKYCANKR